MKTWTIVLVMVVSGAVGILFMIFAFDSGYSVTASVLLFAPLIVSIFVASFTVFAHGSLTLQREAAAAFVSYAALTLLTGVAFLVDEPEITAKFVDALLFGQVIALLSVVRTCLESWNNPVAKETKEQRLARHAAAAQVRKANYQ
ncbi:hypothetical protein [Arthrobacter agilis]|uniref:hypothetical protein n=1 Tax=Arthrobacter agilis TaxID=37921 RepID=UPI0027812C6B|nr:hypothetical protein [Arthrobacter agilis]MDQ0735163.1 uncharacterized membrane protein HdeD (DUF308 family) [Arthrobacter agilis]